MFVNMLQVIVQTEVELEGSNDPTNHSPAKDRGDKILLVGTCGIKALFFSGSVGKLSFLTWLL